MVKIASSKILILACASVGTKAFAPQQRSRAIIDDNAQHSIITRTTTTALNAFALQPDKNHNYHYDEDDALRLMLKAKECAFSDTCSIDDAKYYMGEVLHVESGCVAGTLSSKNVCDVSVAADIVANLRAKIERDIGNVQPRMTVLPTNPALQLLFIATVGMMMTVALTTTISGLDTTTPFTLQEWWWAAKDGYLPTMLSHFIKHGVTPQDIGTTTTTSSAIPFTLQEWGWAVRDGYLPKMMEESMKYGGLAVDGTVDTTTPFTPQEWWWAARDGYLPTMISDFAKNGGL